MSTLEKNIHESTDAINCAWEQGEQTKIKQLGKEMEKIAADKAVLKDNTLILGEQMINRGMQPEKLTDFLNSEIRNRLLPIKAQWDKLSKDSKDVNAVNEFVKKIAAELKLCTQNKTDVVMALQVYLNALNDFNGKHALIPYSNSQGYKKDTERRLVVDGYLGPHTYNALWLSLFGEQLAPEVIITKKSLGGVIKEDGTVYLPGPDGKYKPYYYETDKYAMEGKNGQQVEMKDIPLHFQKLNLFLKFYEGWKEKAIQVANTRNKLNSSWFDNEKKQIEDKIAAIDGFIQGGIEKINANPKLTLNYDALFKKINAVEEIEDIYGKDDVADAKKALEMKTGYDAAERKLISYSRHNARDAFADVFGMAGGGNSEYAKNRLADERLLKKKEYAPIMNVINKPEVVDCMEANDVEGLTNLIRGGLILAKNAQPIAKEIIKEYQKIKAKNNKVDQQKAFRDQINAAGVDTQTKKDIMAQWNNAYKNNPSMQIKNRTQYVSKATAEATRTATAAAGVMLLKDLMIEGKLSQRIASKATLDYDERKMKDIMGIGNFDISDKNADYVAEATQTIALSAVTMGVGGLAARAALAGAKWIASATRITNLMVKLETSGNRASKIATALKWGVNTGIEGAAFYEGSNAMTNLITKDIDNMKDLFENGNDWKEIAKSMAFVGVLKSLGKMLKGNAKTLTSTNKGGWKVLPWEKFPAPGSFVGRDVLNNFGKILVQGGMLTLTSQTVEFVFEGETHWTVEEFVQACILTRVMGSAGKLEQKMRFRKTAQGMELVPYGQDRRVIVRDKSKVPAKMQEETPGMTEFKDKAKKGEAKEKFMTAEQELNAATIERTNAKAEFEAAKKEYNDAVNENPGSDRTKRAADRLTQANKRRREANKRYEAALAKLNALYPKEQQYDKETEVKKQEQKLLEEAKKEAGDKLTDWEVREQYSTKREGTFDAQGRLQGKGKITREFGLTQEGTFKDGILVEGKSYSKASGLEEGHFNAKGELHGEGARHSPNGTLTEGTWENGIIREGKVKFEHDGSVHEGKFNEKGALEKGTITKADGTVTNIG